MKVREIMSRNIFSVLPDTPVKEVFKKMLEYDTSYLPVVDQENKLLGYIPEEYLLTRVKFHKTKGEDYTIHLNYEEFIEEQRKLYGAKASEIMKKDPVVINENMDIIDAIELMLKEKISLLPIIRKDKLIGFLTYHDVLKTLLSLEEGRFLELQPLNDAEIANKVTLALRKNIEFQIHNLKVRSGKGIIYLEGTVSSSEDYNTATEIAKSLPGVKEVENYLLIEHILD